MKILIVDDDRIMIELLVNVLRENFPGLSILQTRDALAALEILEKENPDIILSDWKMPARSGIQLLEHIRNNEALQDIPVIICSGVHITSRDLQEALEKGAIDFIKKPFDEVELVARISSAFRFKERLDFIYTQRDTLRSQLMMMNDLIKTNPDLLAKDLKQKIRGFNEAVEEQEMIFHRITQQKDKSWHFKALKKRFQSLTQADLELCFYYKLGMSNKEVASIKAITPESAKKARHRLRKKLKLTRKADLYDFLNALSN